MATANNSNGTSNGRRNSSIPIKTSLLKHLKQKLKLILSSKSDVPSTKTGTNSKRGVIFRDEAMPHKKLTNIKETLSSNEAYAENIEIRNEII